MIDLDYPQRRGEHILWAQVQPEPLCLAVAELAARSKKNCVLVLPPTQSLSKWQALLSFFKPPELPLLHLPAWETLPYERLSPLPDLVAQRLQTLYQLLQGQEGILLLNTEVLQQYVLPPDHLQSHDFKLVPDQIISPEILEQRLLQAGYRPVDQVLVPGEFSRRRDRLDLFSTAEKQPCRLIWQNERIQSLRWFDAEQQRSFSEAQHCQILPAKEWPAEALNDFAQAYEHEFHQKIDLQPLPAGIEYYLPLFYDGLASLFDYIGEEALWLIPDDLYDLSRSFFEQLKNRQGRLDLAPERLYLTPEKLQQYLKPQAYIRYTDQKINKKPRGIARQQVLPFKPLPDLQIQIERPATALHQYLEQAQQPVLFSAESPGRQQHILSILQSQGIQPQLITDWRQASGLSLSVAPLEQGFELDSLIFIPEAALLAELPEIRRDRDQDTVLRSLSEIQIGDAVVHEDQGVGRYRGLQKLNLSGYETEMIAIEYAGGDMLYVPITELHRISRYIGQSEQAPWHSLGSKQWQKIKQRAQKRIEDLAAQLLDIYARRAQKKGYAYPFPEAEYRRFAAEFPFNETPDQAKAIQEVIADLCADQPMDRLVCGDVGFGKTEVAMRAAFIVAMAGKQVAVLVPTTLLAQQHYDQFSDRFADWGVNIGLVSRFSQQNLQAIADGQVDIIIGTHKLLGEQVKFKDLGLLIIDEEQRFGVKHKERLKALRAEIDILTLSATPIPRTLNLALSGLRDLSIIATPPAKRHPIKTFIEEWNDQRIIEACQRELHRGGQVFVLHNEVKTIAQMQERMQKLLPEAKVQSAHGQMRQRELKKIMNDFYHQRFHILVTTTIIESGIDIASANTIIINRADKLGLAQLYQIRGRVGRSHHRAYAYLIVPPKKAMTADAIKRLQAMAELEELGSGFNLASYDLDIRGAGSLLGKEQSGHMEAIGFELYQQMLAQAVQAIKQNGQINWQSDGDCQIELGLPCFLPEDYVPDIQQRLSFYRRLLSASQEQQLLAIQMELIDRFGHLPEAAQNLLKQAEIRLQARALGLSKVELGEQEGRLKFAAHSPIDPMILVQWVQSDPEHYQLSPEQFKFKFKNNCHKMDCLMQLFKRLHHARSH